MRKLIIKSNACYDMQKEPKRFLIFLSILIPSIILINLGIPVLAIIGASIMLLSTIWRFLGKIL